MIGASISHCKVTSKLREGRMGEVWRTKDTKLGRDVALKGLPDYEAGGDGKRFVTMSGSAEMEATEDWVTLVTGWYNELETLVPGDSR